MDETGPNGNLAGFARRLMRGHGRAALATSMRGAPYASLVLYVPDLDASPFLLLSDLAQHSRNIAFDPRISLLIDATEGHPDPLTGPRLTLIGRAEPAAADTRRLARFAAHHPASRLYAGFADFRLYRMAVERAHLVAGFGRIHWLEGRDLVLGADFGTLAAAEPDILREINEADADALSGWVGRLLGRPGLRCELTGIDPEGIDLRCGGETARLDFPEIAATPDELRAALALLAERAAK
jgi:putative heme iron utilization protein